MFGQHVVFSLEKNLPTQPREANDSPGRRSAYNGDADACAIARTRHAV